MAQTTPSTPIERLAQRFESAARDLRSRADLVEKGAKSAWDAMHLDRFRDELVGASDDLRLQLHLASMEARDALGKVQTQIDHLRDAADLELDHVAHDLAEGIERITRALRTERKS